MNQTQTDLVSAPSLSPSPSPAPRLAGFDARLAALELQAASQALTIDALVRTFADLADVAKRAQTRLEAAERGIKLGRPVGSRGAAAHPSDVGRRDAADLGFSRSGSAGFASGAQSETLPGIAGLRGTDEAISECLSEAIVNLFVVRNVPSLVIPVHELEDVARVYQAELGRGWPFSSRKHFARRVTMFADELLAHGVRASKSRTSDGKVFWRFEQLAADGFPVAVEPVEAASEPAETSAE